MDEFLVAIGERPPTDAQVAARYELAAQAARDVAAGRSVGGLWAELAQLASPPATTTFDDDEDEEEFAGRRSHQERHCWVAPVRESDVEDIHDLLDHAMLEDGYAFMAALGQPREEADVGWNDWRQAEILFRMERAGPTVPATEESEDEFLDANEMPWLFEADRRRDGFIGDIWQHTGQSAGITELDLALEDFVSIDVDYSLTPYDIVDAELAAEPAHSPRA